MTHHGKDADHRSSGAGSDVPPPEAFLTEARKHLRSERLKEAYSVILKAMAAYAEHPVILSYYGWLQAVVDKKPRSGVTFCRRAVTSFSTSDRRIAASIYPVLYLNLGKALVLAGRKKDALESFSKGLSYDRGNRLLLKEMSLLGTRKPPVLPFLSRSNPLNKLLGKLRHKPQ